MTEYLAPGVYLEEFTPGAKPIEGVETSTAGFVGATERGPMNVAAGPLHSFAEFASQFGDAATLQYPGTPSTPAFLCHAARAFFVEGGTRLYVSRATATTGDGSPARPRPDDYARGLAALETMADIALVAAPGSTLDGDTTSHDDAMSITGALIAHAERMRYRIAVLDTPDAQSVEHAGAWARHFSSSRATLCFPWIAVADAQSASQVLVPPSGAVAGLYARSDRQRGVHASPANEIVQGAVGVGLAVNDEQSKVLVAQGVNPIRALPDRGIRLWGARTLTSDSDWKYVNVRRLLLFIEASIERGLQWAVFEPNGEALWANVRRTIADFLLNQWRSGALAGTRADAAFFVTCDRTTMTQDDIDNGRLIVLIGTAPVRPAEFVIVRITVQTDHRPCANTDCASP